jgi:hypothetical protein
MPSRNQTTSAIYFLRVAAGLIRAHADLAPAPRSEGGDPGQSAEGATVRPVPNYTRLVTAGFATLSTIGLATPGDLKRFVDQPVPVSLHALIGDTAVAEAHTRAVAAGPSYGKLRATYRHLLRWLTFRGYSPDVAAEILDELAEDLADTLQESGAWT